ncbi:MAG: GNAT family N-acetyltransferase [Proteobacteria bacterium]|nr:GNAT family N-acetyltransferase [Pseudomonadota bacterium]
MRPLVEADLDAVVSIDAFAEGVSRRPYFERRLAAALREPAWHVQLAVDDGEAVTGYLLGRILDGEFGQPGRSLWIEAIGVRHDAKGAGLGRRMLDSLIEVARRHELTELRTQAAWRDHALLRWLDEGGFALAPNHIVDCPVEGGAYAEARDAVPAAAAANDGASEREQRYAAGASNDFERLARDGAEICAMEEGDLADVLFIDRAITGRDREAYMRRRLDEALRDSAIRVSLIARRDGAAAGFATARVDIGEFGRTAPVAVLDTIGVHPERRRGGIGHALVSQLFANLGALRVERVETMVAPRDLALLGFLYAIGFAPAQSIPFVRAL